METTMNNNRIEDVLGRQKRSLGMDTLVALVVALGLFVCILGLHSASQARIETASALPQPSAAVTVAADLRDTACAPSAANLC